MDINGSEFLVIALLALILVGPDRLPEYVRGLRGAVFRIRAMLKDGQATLKEELGEDVDWSQLDPRNYDPRRIVREALFADEGTIPAAGNASVAATGAIGTATPGLRAKRTGSRATDAAAGADGANLGLAPFDIEAT